MLRVVDFSALWAGPQCADLLGLAGADLIKVETPDRPDGARRGHCGFYRLLHAGHRSVVLDRPRRAAAAADSSGWVRGTGSPRDDLDAAALDRLHAERPVRVQHRSSALWTVNSRGAAALGLAAAR